MEISIKTVKLSAIKLNKDNPRRISNQDMDRLVKSLQDFPEMMKLREIVVDETMTVLGGNMRYLALKKIGAKECTAKIVSGLTPEQKREFVIKDNSQFGEWDMDLLSGQWSDLPLVDWGVDLPEDWLKAEPCEPADAEPQIDRAEELNKTWKVKTGDLWQIGDHRLLCGDSTKKEDVGRVMGGEKADMVFTDPPYGVAYADKNKYLNAISRGNRIQTEIVGDHETVEKLAEAVIYPAFCRVKEVLAERSSYYITAPQGGDLLMMMMMMQKAGLILRHMIIWVKNNHVLGRTDYNYKHEPILFGWVNVHDFYGLGEYKFSTWEIDKPLKSDLHPTMKPVELVVNAILNSCPKDGIMADLFGGSGTSMVAAENTGRKCRMVEVTPAYCAVILQRMKDAVPGIEIKRIEANG
jgi:DNA modification methylase